MKADYMERESNKRELYLMTDRGGKMKGTSSELVLGMHTYNN